MVYNKHPIFGIFVPSNTRDMLLLNIDTHKKIPVYKQINNQIIQLIHKGVLKDGSILPSSRILAHSLGINRSTVCKAYQDLWALGYIDTRQGSYSVIRSRKEMAHHTSQSEMLNIPWIDYLNDDSKRMFAGAISPASIDTDVLPENTIDFSKLDVDTRLIPVDEIRRYLQKMVVTENHQLFGYEHPKGNVQLRKGIAQRLSLHGIDAHVDEILVTHGSNQAIDLIFRTYLNEGDMVAIEAPTYQLIPYMLRYYKASVIEIPMLTTGLDTEAFERAARTHRIKFLYTIPNLQNPSGISTSQDHREKVLEICERYHILIIEDGYEEEMKYFGKVHLPIKSMDKHKQVFYISSLSKVFSPGLRLGWVVAHPDSIDQLCALKRLNDVSSNTFSQTLVARLLDENFVDVYIKRANRITKKRMLIAIHMLNKLKCEGFISFEIPLGGFLLWLKIHTPNKPGVPWDVYFAKYNIAVSHGDKFFWTKPADSYIRISISRLTEAEIETGITRIGEGLRDLL